MIKPLTSLRWWAALLVFVSHVPPVSAYDESAFRFGAAGVQFFFVLSGFIMVYVYGNLGIRDYYRFLVHRFARIYPVVLLAVIVALIVTIHQPLSWWALVRELTLTQGWWRPEGALTYFNFQAWTLSDEAFFYLTFPLTAYAVFWAVPRIRAWFLLVIFLTLVGFEMKLLVADVELTYRLPLCHLHEFVIGAVTAKAWITRSSVPRQGPQWQEWAVVVLAILGIALTPFMIASLNHLWLAPVWSLMIYVMASQSGTVSRWLSARPLVFLGEISYSFYMLNHIALLLTRSLWALPAAIGLAAAVYVYFETPLRRRIIKALLPLGLPAFAERTSL